MSCMHQSIMHGTGEKEHFSYIHSPMVLKGFFWCLNMPGFFSSKPRIQPIILLLLILPLRHIKHLKLKILFTMPFSMLLSIQVTAMTCWQMPSFISLTNIACVSGFLSRWRSEMSNDSVHQQRCFFNEQWVHTLHNDNAYSMILLLPLSEKSLCCYT